MSGDIAECNSYCQNLLHNRPSHNSMVNYNYFHGPECWLRVSLIWAGLNDNDLVSLHTPHPLSGTSRRAWVCSSHGVDRGKDSKWTHFLKLRFWVGTLSLLPPSFVQSKFPSLPRFRSWGNRFHFLMEEPEDPIAEGVDTGRGGELEPLFQSIPQSSWEAFLNFLDESNKRLPPNFRSIVSQAKQRLLEKFIDEKPFGKCKVVH